MDWSRKIEATKARIEELRKMKDILYQIEDAVCDIEREISRTDGSIPQDKVIDAMPAGAEKEQILHLIDLENEAFGLIDEILGPPDDDITSMPQGKAYSPEARGTVSLDEALSHMIKHGGKHNAS